MTKNYLKITDYEVTIRNKSQFSVIVSSLNVTNISLGNGQMTLRLNTFVGMLITRLGTNFQVTHRPDVKATTLHFFVHSLIYG